MKDIFSGNIYNTSPDKVRNIMDRVFLETRFWFYFKVLQHINGCSRTARSGPLGKDDFAKYSYRVMTEVENVGGRLNVVGLNNIPIDIGPVVFIGNHMSLLETLLLPFLIHENHDHEVTFVIKQDLLEYPVFGRIMRSIGAVPVGRNNPREDLKNVLKEGRKLLDNGKSVVIFPQSSRSVEFKPELFNSIGVKLARMVNVPVVPLALKTDFLENGTWLKDFGPLHREKVVRFHFGEIMRIEDKGKEEHQKIVDFISSKMSEWLLEDKSKVLSQANPDS